MKEVWKMENKLDLDKIKMLLNDVEDEMRRQCTIKTTCCEGCPLYGKGFESCHLDWMNDIKKLVTKIDNIDDEINL